MVSFTRRTISPGQNRRNPRQGIETSCLPDEGVTISCGQNRRNPRQGIETLHRRRPAYPGQFVRIDEIPVRGLKLVPLTTNNHIETQVRIDEIPVRGLKPFSIDDLMLLSSFVRIDEIPVRGLKLS